MVINIGSIQRKLLSHLWLETEQQQQQQQQQLYQDISRTERFPKFADAECIYGK